MLVTRAAAAQVLLWREQKDEWGRHVWTYEALAKELGVSETTIRRIVLGQYRWKELPEMGQLRTSAEESERRMVQELAGESLI